MSKFISIPGMRPFYSSDRPGHAPIDEIPQFNEWLKSRDATSHDALGLDPGMKVDFVTNAGEVRRNSEIIREERDEHTGKIDVRVKSIDSTGKPNEHKLTFEPHKDRSMIQTHNRRVK